MNADELVIKAQNGDNEAVNELIEKYFPLVSVNAKKYFIIGGEQEDLVQEGLLGLLKAIKFYDSSKSSFNSFAILCVRHQILSAIKSANSQKNLVLNEAILNSTNNSSKENKEYDLELLQENETPENIFFNKEKIKSFIEYSKDNFSKFEKEVFEYMIRGYSYKEIAKHLQQNTKSIDNAIQRIKKKSEIWINKYNLE